MSDELDRLTAALADKYAIEREIGRGGMVEPCGYARNLTDGIIRARYRTPRTGASFIEPGKVYEYTIDLWATSNLFRKGHRIRLEVSSSNFPRFDRNTNTGEPIGTDAGFVSALQTVYHTSQYPSHVTLPVVPR